MSVQTTGSGGQSDNFLIFGQGYSGRIGDGKVEASPPKCMNSSMEEYPRKLSIKIGNLFKNSCHPKHVLLQIQILL